MKRKFRAVPSLLLFVGFLSLFAARWYLRQCGDQGINAILFTLTTGTAGVAWGIWIGFAKDPLLKAVLCTGLVCFLLRRRKNKTFASVSAVSCLALMAASLYAVGLPQWLVQIHGEGRLFTQEYVEPDSVQISFPKKKRNLVYIFMESMETTFFSQEQGGRMDACVIPELYALAAENTNFSMDDGVGGWECVTGGTWTTAGVVSQMGGIPLLIPYDLTAQERQTRPLPGATLLWDILHREGYYQMVMMGSDRDFSDQFRLMTLHGIDAVKDSGTAVDDGIIPEGYFEWWGMEDEKVFAYARQELSRIALQEQPFSFTLFTIDTHYPRGYSCRLCGTERAEDYENVYACTSAQVAAFVSWLQEQPFYADTTVILCGDHLSMDQEYIRRNNLEHAPRRVFNCILNAPIPGENTRNRVFSSLDMFPTTLAALGCQITGERLGLGTNLYSGLPTLEERLGIEKLNAEITRATLPFCWKFLRNEEPA